MILADAVQGPPGLEPQSQEHTAAETHGKAVFWHPFVASTNGALLILLDYLRSCRWWPNDLLAQGTLQIPMKPRTLLVRPW